MLLKIDCLFFRQILLINFFTVSICMEACKSVLFFLSLLLFATKSNISSKFNCYFGSNLLSSLVNFICNAVLLATVFLHLASVKYLSCEMGTGYCFPVLLLISCMNYFQLPSSLLASNVNLVSAISFSFVLIKLSVRIKSSIIDSFLSFSS